MVNDERFLVVHKLDNGMFQICGINNTKLFTQILNKWLREQLGKANPNNNDS